MFKLVQQTQQHDKLQVEWKQQLADVKKKLLESQTEIVKLHCKLQEVRNVYSNINVMNSIHMYSNFIMYFVEQAITISKESQTEIEQLKRSGEQMQGKGNLLFRIQSK